MKKIIGIETIDYTNKQGNPVRGHRVYIGENGVEHVQGLKVESEFISDRYLQGEIPALQSEVQGFKYSKGFGNNYICTGIF